MVNKDHLRQGEKIQISSSLIAGSFSGLMARTLTAPMDTIKIRLQVMPATRFLSMIRDVFRQEGVKGFWKGNVPGSAMYVIYGGVQFGSYSFYNDLLNQFNWWGPQFHGLIIGALAGMTSGIVSYPCDVLRTKFAADQSAVLSKLAKSISEIWHQNGFNGFFKGCCTYMLSISLSTSIVFGTYESIKVYCDTTRNQIQSIQAPTENNLILDTFEGSASSIGAVLAKLFSFPLDTARRRLMIGDSMVTMIRSTPRTGRYYERYKNRGIIRIIYEVVHYEGICALYRGLPLALCKSIPTTAMSFWSFETCLKLLGN